MAQDKCFFQQFISPNDNTYFLTPNNGDLMHEPLFIKIIMLHSPADVFCIRVRKTRTQYSHERVLDFYLKIRRLYSRKEYNGTFFLTRRQT